MSDFPFLTFLVSHSFLNGNRKHFSVFSSSSRNFKKQSFNFEVCETSKMLKHWLAVHVPKAFFSFTRYPINQ